MLSTGGGRLSTVLAALVVLPGIAAAQSVGQSVVPDASPVVRAVGSFVLVGVVGAAFLARHSDVVEEAVDDTTDRPAAAIAYGMFAYVVVAFASLFVTNLLIQAGVAATPLAYLVVAVPVVGLLALGGLGFAVVGALVTELAGPRRLGLGVLFGAVVSAVAWLALPLLPAFVAWLLVAGFGIGGRTRTWIHNERTVRSELEA